jgi:hypothetical protein
MTVVAAADIVGFRDTTSSAMISRDSPGIGRPACCQRMHPTRSPKSRRCVARRTRFLTPILTTDLSGGAV